MGRSAQPSRGILPHKFVKPTPSVSARGSHKLAAFFIDVQMHPDTGPAPVDVLN